MKHSTTKYTHFMPQFLESSPVCEEDLLKIFNTFLNGNQL